MSNPFVPPGQAWSCGLEKDEENLLKRNLRRLSRENIERTLDYLHARVLTEVTQDFDTRTYFLCMFLDEATQCGKNAQVFASLYCRMAFRYPSLDFALYDATMKCFGSYLQKQVPRNDRTVNFVDFVLRCAEFRHFSVLGLVDVLMLVTHMWAPSEPSYDAAKRILDAIKRSRQIRTGMEQLQEQLDIMKGNLNSSIQPQTRYHTDPHWAEVQNAHLSAMHEASKTPSLQFPPNEASTLAMMHVSPDTVTRRATNGSQLSLEIHQPNIIVSAPTQTSLLQLAQEDERTTDPQYLSPRREDPSEGTDATTNVSSASSVTDEDSLASTMSGTPMPHELLEKPVRDKKKKKKKSKSKINDKDKEYVPTLPHVFTKYPNAFVRKAAKHYTAEEKKYTPAERDRLAMLAVINKSTKSRVEAARCIIQLAHASKSMSYGSARRKVDSFCTRKGMQLEDIKYLQNMVSNYYLWGSDDHYKEIMHYCERNPAVPHTPPTSCPRDKGHARKTVGRLDFAVYDRIIVRETHDVHRTSVIGAMVMFIGTTQFAPGLWIGIALDVPQGHHNGIVHGKRYFRCRDLHGLFVRLSCVVCTSLTDKPEGITRNDLMSFPLAVSGEAREFDVRPRAFFNHAAHGDKVALGERCGTLVGARYYIPYWVLDGDSGASPIATSCAEAKQLLSNAQIVSCKPPIEPENGTDGKPKPSKNSVGFKIEQSPTLKALKHVLNLTDKEKANEWIQLLVAPPSVATEFERRFELVPRRSAAGCPHRYPTKAYSGAAKEFREKLREARMASQSEAMAVGSAAAQPTEPSPPPLEPVFPRNAWPEGQIPDGVRLEEPKEPDA